MDDFALFFLFLKNKSLNVLVNKYESNTCSAMIRDSSLHFINLVNVYRIKIRNEGLAQYSLFNEKQVCENEILVVHRQRNPLVFKKPRYVIHLFK